MYLRELYVDVQLWGPDESKRVYEILGGDDHTLRNNTSKEVTVLMVLMSGLEVLVHVHKGIS